MDISSLTAEGAPNAQLLRVLSLIYGICMILMVIGLVINAFKRYNGKLKTGCVILLIMQVTSAFGYNLFPLTGDKTEMNFQNMMHIIVTVVVVFTTIASSFLIALGYRKQENTKKFGKIALVFAILITVFGMFNPISMGMQLNILGLSERLVIYTIQVFMLMLSFYHTFLENRKTGQPKTAGI
jgi:dolichyl-phosphate-mannose--protein O-mannosyl transferase